jgi:hypothetical protein
MKYLLLSLMLLVGCSADKETVFVSKGVPGGNGSSCTTYPVEGGSNVKCGDTITFIANGAKGDVGAAGSNGSSCSVAPEYAELEDEIFGLSNELVVIGAKISCTDGTSQVVYNGDKGDAGADGLSCSTSTNEDGNVVLSCPNQDSLIIYNGRDGDSCTTKRQSSKKRTKITCGSTVSYVYDGKKGKKGDSGEPGTSCTATEAEGGVNVICGNSVVFLADGEDGQKGKDAIQPGLLCNVHNVGSWSGNTDLPGLLKASPVVGSFVLANLSVGDSLAVNGFPGMPADLRTAVGVEGYALDCSGYLNIKTSGEYTLKLLSDDGVRLNIEDDYLLVQDQGLHAPRTVSGTKLLNKGPNKFNVVYFQGPVTQIALQLKMSGPNMTETVVPVSDFTH